MSDLLVRIAPDFDLCMLESELHVQWWDIPAVLVNLATCRALADISFTSSSLLIRTMQELLTREGVQRSVRRQSAGGGHEAHD